MSALFNFLRFKTMFEEAVRNRQFLSSQLLEEKYIEELLFKYSMDSMDELYAAIGSGSLVAAQVAGRFIALYLKDHNLLKKRADSIKIKHNNDGIVVDGTTGLLVRYAGCCHPVAGDDIVGYISQGKGVTIHRKDCLNLKYLDPMRIVNVEWEEKAQRDFIIEIKLIAEKTPTILNKITSNITASKISLRAFEAKETSDQIECNIIVFVKSRDEVENIVNMLSQINGVKKVTRIN